MLRLSSVGPYNPVALLAEGVDRNFAATLAVTAATGSPSSRRAWIEIQVLDSHSRRAQVALLAEGVDRNLTVGDEVAQLVRSPSSRRAWIEIGRCHPAQL